MTFEVSTTAAAGSATGATGGGASGSTNGACGSECPTAVLILSQTSGRGSTDLNRLVALYRGAKSYSVARCRRLSGEVDREFEAVLVRIVLDEERQIRWAELRIVRLSSRETERDTNFVLERVHRALESAWERPWRRLVLEFREGI